VIPIVRMGTDLSSDPLDDFYACCSQWFFTATRDGIVLRLSAPLARVLGPEVQKETRLADRVHPDDRPAFAAAWARIDEDAEPTPFHFRLQGADGGFRRVSCSARRSPTSRDVHGSLQESGPALEPAETKFEREAKLLHVLQDNLPIAVWAIDPQGIFTHHQGKGVEAAGLQAGQLLGLNVFDLYGQNAEAIGGIRQALAGELVHVFTTSHDVAWESWDIPVRDEHGEVTEVVGITIDLSEAKRAEKELREKLALIQRQQLVIRSLSMPIIEVWDKVLTLPLLGVVDSTRAADVMENLLEQVSLKGARFAILDLTGVEAVDTSSASHLLKLIHAIRLLGAESIITGIQPSVARTMVELGVNLARVVTLATLRDGLRYCIKRMSDSPA
jgi:rsbT co-antagonist protein RsbR